MLYEVITPNRVKPIATLDSEPVITFLNSDIYLNGPASLETKATIVVITSYSIHYTKLYDVQLLVVNCPKRLSVVRMSDL